LKAYAAKYHPVIGEHLKMAEETEKKLK